MNLIRKFVLPALLCIAAALNAQTPISGTFTVGATQVANGSVTFALLNCGTTPTAGSATYSATLNSSGVISTAVQGNSGNGCVQLSGVNVSYFQVTLSDSASKLIWRRNYQVPVQTGAWNLSTATPLTTIPPTVSQASLGVNSVNGKTGSSVTLTAGDVGALSTSGGAVTGPITLPSDPSSSLQAATKRYVDNHINKCTSAVVQAAPGVYVVGTTVSTSFPANTTAGNLLYVVADAIGLSGSSYAGITGISDTQGNIFTPIATLNWSVFNKPHIIWVAPNIVGGADTITVTASGSTPSIDLDAVEYSGLALTSPVDVSAGDGSAGSPVTLNGINIKQPYERLVGTIFSVTSATAPGYTVDATMTYDFVTLSSTATVAGPQSVVAPYVPFGSGSSNSVYTAFSCPAGASTPSLNWRGTWSSLVTYEVFDTVNYNGSSYVALQSALNQEPDTASAYWGQVSKAGNSQAVVVTLISAPVFNGLLGDAFKITLAASPTVTSSTIINTSGLSTVKFEIVQDSTGSRPFVWPTNVHSPGTIGTAANSHSVQIFLVDPTDGSLWPASAMQIN